MVNAKGERFVNELDTRDVVSSSIIRECEEGRGIRTMSGRIGVWLDTPLLDAEHGPGTLEKHFPAMMLQFDRFGIDISKDPVLIYPTLHYQNGGVKIDTNSETNVRQSLRRGRGLRRIARAQSIDGQFAPRPDGLWKTVWVDGRSSCRCHAARKVDGRASEGVSCRGQEARQCERSRVTHDSAGVHKKRIEK